MGAQPFLALNVAAMPVDLDREVIKQIFRGGAEKVKEAGAVIGGGHSVQDKEPKYGLVALGMVDESALLTKRGAQPGDVLVLTKPLGTGVTTTALMRDRGTPEHEEEAVKWMTLLNSGASSLASMVGVRAATDITGFGLIGHGLELADASGMGLAIEFEQVPLLSGASGYAALGTFPGGTLDNRKFFSDRVEFSAELSEAERLLLFDAQTSGGLLMAIPEAAYEQFSGLAKEKDVAFWRIGAVHGGSGIAVTRN